MTVVTWFEQYGDEPPRGRCGVVDGYVVLNDVIVAVVKSEGGFCQVPIADLTEAEDDRPRTYDEAMAVAARTKE